MSAAPAGSEDASLPLVEVSVIVPCRNEARAIEAFIGEVMGQDFHRDAFEVIVADGMSDDGTREILSRLGAHFRNLRMIDNPRGAVSPGLNAAIAEARGDIIVRMDVHASYAPDYLSRCVELLRQGVADNVGGAARTRAEGRFQCANALAYASWFSVGGARFHTPDYEGYVDTVTFGCWYRCKLIELGMFDEELVRNQDDELNLRTILAGGRIYQSASIRCWYHPRSSWISLFRQYMQYGYWKVRVIQKHRAVASWRHLVPVTVLVIGILLLLAAPFSSAASALLLAGLASYLVCSLAVSARIATKARSLDSFPLLPGAFAAYHFGYAIGFARGILAFVVRRKLNHSSMQTLTR